MRYIKELKCLICGKMCKNKVSLFAHVYGGHKIKFKEYYDKYLKKERGGTCLVCEKEKTILRNMIIKL
jgi:hypothetical protein